MLGEITELFFRRHDDCCHRLRTGFRAKEGLTPIDKHWPRGNAWEGSWIGQGF